MDQPQTESMLRQEHVFVLRLWYEPGGTSPGQWRGYVTHAPSGERLPVTRLEDLLVFVSARMDGFASESLASVPVPSGENKNE